MRQAHVAICVSSGFVLKFVVTDLSYKPAKLTWLARSATIRLQFGDETIEIRGPHKKAVLAGAQR
jgi:hypothetical protein